MTGTRVGHVEQNADEVDHYVGRGPTGEHLKSGLDVGERGWLGNPYRGDDYDRREAILRFREDFEARLGEDPDFRDAVADLAGDVLGCHCRRLDEDEPACHADVVAEHADRLGGSTAANPAETAAVVGERLQAAGLDPSTRFIDVENGTKRTLMHGHNEGDNRFGPDRVSGNYGIYAGDGPGGWLVDVDVDDYQANIDEPEDAAALAAVKSLPDTLTVESPHTDGENGGHRFYAVEPGEEYDDAREALEAVTGNAHKCQPSWGDLQVGHAYVVGPGSTLDSCDKDWHDCSQPGEGAYQIADERDVATISADDLAAVLRADPEFTSDGEDSDDQQQALDDVAPPDDPAADGLTDNELLEKARQSANGDRFADLYDRGVTRGSWSGNDHSRADLEICNKLAFWTGGDRQRMDRLFRNSALMRPKWDDKHRADGATYGEMTIEKALEGQTDFYDPDEGDGNAVGGATATDGGEAGTSEGGDAAPPPDDTKLTGGNVIARAADDPSAGLADLSDREKAWGLVRILDERDDYHLLGTVPDGQIMNYDDGVWVEEGEQVLRETGSEALGKFFGRNVLDEMVENVRAQHPVAREELGTSRRTLAVENGLLDLEAAIDGVDEGALRDLRPDDLAINRLPGPFDPAADCERWRKFVAEVVEEHLRDAVQEFVGYCLLAGEMPFDRALLLVGGGANGKSTFLNVVAELLGPENVTGFSLGDLAHNEYHVAEMWGAIANIDADVTGGIGHGGMFKKLTGGDRRVAARRPYHEPFTFHPTTKQLYSANEVPDTKVDDDGFFRRWLLVEFPRVFTDPGEPGPDKDPDLEAKLLEERPGILNWAIEGLARLLEQGHFTGEGTTDEKRNKWQSWGNTIDKFVNRGVDLDTAAKWTAGEVYERYSEFVTSELGETPEDQRKLTAELKKQPGVRYSSAFRFDGKQQRGFKGFGFTDAVPDPDDRPSQQEVVDAVVAAVADKDHLDAGVPWNTVVETVQRDLGAAEPRVGGVIETLLRKGELMEPADGTLRTS